MRPGRGRPRDPSRSTDEPAPLGGTDRAVDPLELHLASLGTCLTIGWVTQAAKRGVDSRDLTIEVRGEYDLRGYRALDDDVQPGFSAIGYSVNVESDAPAELLDEIRVAAERTSPMFDNVINGAPVAGSVTAVSPSLSTGPQRVTFAQTTAESESSTGYRRP